MRSRRAGLAAIAVVALACAWLVRPIFHGPVMLLWTKPLIWALPLVILALTLILVRRQVSPMELRAGRRPPTVLLAGPILAFFVFVFGGVINGALVGRSLYKHTTYEQIPGLPSGGKVRLLPKEVAVQIASSGFNSPTEHLTDFHIVRTPQGQRWTALRTPDGLFRVFSKKSQGIVSLDAEQTARTLKEVDAPFKYAPGQQITDNLRWRLLKKHFLITLAETSAVLGADGRPLIVAPYIKYKGWLVRRPVFGGVFVVHPDGRIEDLTPAQARRRPELVASGRLFPEALARNIQDAYSYKRGIANRIFTHTEQTQITDTEANQQPYLIDFGARGSKWVTVAEPYGRAFAVNAIFLTDTVTGKTQVWRVPRGTSLTGNRRALETVRSVSIPGVVFSDQQTQSPGGGRFRTVEPRPVFVAGRLVYLISIIPESANSVSKTVIVDAARNKLVTIFDNDSDPQAEAKTLEYLRTGVVPGTEAAADTQAPPENSAGATTPATPLPKGSARDLQRRLDSVIKRQRELLKETQDLRKALGGG
ncbi:MAG: hypothetical protein ABI950_03155 [Solirubrobacteraceae bacterium]